MTSYKNETSSTLELIINGAKGFAISVIAAALMLFGFAAIASGMDDPALLIAPLGYAALFLSTAVGGAVAARVSGTTGIVSLLSAAAVGVFMLVLLLAMSFLPAETTAEPLAPLTKVLMYLAVPIASVLGGAVFGKKNSRKKRRGHNRRR